MSRLKRNTNGMVFFSFLLVLSITLIALFAYGIYQVSGEQRWLPIIVEVVTILATIHVALILLVPIIYALRYMNVSLMSLYLLINAGFGALMSQHQALTTTLLVGIICNCVFYLLLALLLVPAVNSKLAKHLHPFAMKSEDEESDAATTTTTQHHKRTKKRIKHREISIFQDFPSPIPFPAKAIYSYTSKSNNEVSFTKGDQLVIIDCRGNWWQAKHPITGVIGFVPSNYIQVIQKAKVIKAYSATSNDEISVDVGQTVEVIEIHEYACLIRGVDLEVGSIPTECLEMIDVSTPTLGLSTVET